MKFIDKTLNQINGNNLLNVFLTSRWNNITNRYISIGYSNQEFRQNLRPNLKQLLLNEQSNLCCYCMRQINNDDTTTLEHIVPQSTSTIAELNQYTHFAIINDNVCLQSVFDNATTQQNTPPFPLEIAYENLTASCKGDFPGGATYHICNHKRGSSFVEPLFYASAIETEITYRRAGILFSTNSAYDTSITTLNLNYDSLERIRQVWYHISIENLTDIESAVTEEDRNTILTVNLMSLSPARRMQLIADFKTETFWNVLLQYKWFYNYYRTNYPIATR
ncbi:MAG: hypothetical protein KBA13_12045 [Chitinophagales bacterium]|jgi:hypothetical protein|nr:hypothetical protein [Chitinophagales bacterium]